MPPPQPSESGEAVLDTSIWVAVLEDEPAASHLPRIQQQRRAVTNPIVLAELAALQHLGRVENDNAVTDVEQHVRYEPLTREDALEGAQTYARLRSEGHDKVSLADTLIYATARRIQAPLLTLDHDLQDEPGVQTIPQD